MIFSEKFHSLLHSFCSTSSFPPSLPSPSFPPSLAPYPSLALLPLSLSLPSILQYDALPYHYKFVTVLVYIIMFPVEVGRLYLAYEGNLREKVMYTFT